MFVFMASFSISDCYQHHKSNDNTRYKSNWEPQHQLTCKQKLKIYDVLKDTNSNVRNRRHITFWCIYVSDAIQCVYNRKWFEPRSISSSYSVIVQVMVVLKRTVVGDLRFDNLSGSHLQSQGFTWLGVRVTRLGSNICHQKSVNYYKKKSVRKSLKQSGRWRRT